MRILITGSSGLIGSALRPFLRAHGHEPIPLARTRASRVAVFHGEDYRELHRRRDSRSPSGEEKPEPRRGKLETMPHEGKTEPHRGTLEAAPGEGKAEPHRGTLEAAPLWNPRAGTLDWKGAGPFDAVVHLAGENIASGRWTRRKKERILRSRVDGSRLLVRNLARLQPKPRVLVAASAVGIYGTRGDETVDEDSSLGDGFLAEVGRQWEEAARAAAEAGIRVVHLRLGMVLSPRGGALAKLLPVFRMGLGGSLGNGRQWMSWVSIEDVMEAVRFALENDALRGPVNLVSPHPVTNRAFTRTLAGVLHRPARLPVPASLLRLALGEMAEELLLEGARVVPTRLLESGYRFRHPRLREALHDLVAT